MYDGLRGGGHGLRAEEGGGRDRAIGAWESNAWRHEVTRGGMGE